MCSNLLKTCSNVFKLVQNLLKWVQMYSNGFKTCSNVSNVFQPVQNLFKCVQKFSKIIRVSSARGPTWQAELDLFKSLLTFYIYVLCENNAVWKGYFRFRVLYWKKIFTPLFIHSDQLKIQARFIFSYPLPPFYRTKCPSLPRLLSVTDSVLFLRLLRLCKDIDSNFAARTQKHQKVKITPCKWICKSYVPY